MKKSQAKKAQAKKAKSKKAKKTENRAKPPPDFRELIIWYKKNKRLLPWRKQQAKQQAKQVRKQEDQQAKQQAKQQEKSAYTILVSEFMLQQTTVNTVIPYYKKFIKKFKTLKSLAKAPLEEVLPYWSGLGYYSRIKNLHKSARLIQKKNYFPKTYKELLKLPGFGPYTSRALSSLAFNEATGILDINVIRVTSRFLGFKKVWWNADGKKFLQKKVDRWMKNYPSSLLNQSLMELGALVCKAKNPLCFICPLKKNCKAFKCRQTENIPLLKKQSKKEIWFYQALILTQKNQIALVKCHPLPVLKSYPAFPGRALKKNKVPAQYDFIHSITHHTIYVSLLNTLSLKKTLKKSLLKQNPLLWVKTKDIKKQNPSSLLQKILSHKGIKGI